MSNIIGKVKDAITGHDRTTDTTGTTGTPHRTANSGVGTTTDTSATGRTAGPHRSDVANKLDPRADSDRDGSRRIGATGTTGKVVGSGGYGSQHESTNYGPHNTNLANKIDPTVDSDLDGSHRATGGEGYTSSGPGTTGLGPGTHHTTSGPHNSDTLNKIDPRVDSDRDGSRNLGAATYGPGALHGNTHDTGYSGSTSAGTHHTTSGPHNSDTLNKIDPRVDSDRDGSRNLGATTYGPGALHGSTHDTGYSGSTSAGTHHTTSGPHNSDTLNKIDPRVDSDRDGSRNLGATTYGPGALHGNTHDTGYSGSTSAGLHGSGVDPRVDSDRDHRATGTYGTTGGILGSGTHGGPGVTTAGTTHGTKYGTSHGTNTGTTHGVGHTGPARHTAGPHKSDVLNKLDPRVDSDLDGSKTVGGNETFDSSGTHYATH